MYESIERVFQAVVNYGILLLEAVGVVIILLTAARAVCGLLKGQDDVRLTQAQGISLALGFKLGGEVLRTVVARDWNELGIVGAIVALRAAMTFLIYREIENAEKKLLVEGATEALPGNGEK